MDETVNVELITSDEEWSEDNDYRSFFVVKVDGQIEMSFIDGEPEDASLGRDFSDISSIGELLKKVSDGVAKGKKLNISYTRANQYPR